ncbi:HAD family phosphatase [Marivita sp. XM-24bin2]|jgi:HAD superfamily hydrolase (TIGR01509 family)|uniref:HAD family hydrolase n=1 Tax=unclassified Marivita TaxID=2632480 RepID=UPI000D799EA9|nr:HAD family phosphatase [Marivita sp. XM-24bin2]MCR9107979.1 HAD family phosphatase [Paracoccaceae bacterium]PWL35041.1 MAG: CbbY/CbbZ/GpH/YieH [Marivita sp. XM-24bin2]
MPALLFDLDGTMLNSDPIHEAVFTELWTSRGLPVPEGFYMEQVHGRLNVDVFADYLPDEPDPQGLSEWKEAQFRDRLPKPYPATPGLESFLDHALAHHWQLAVVTNAMRLNAEAMLGAIGLRDRFEVIVIGEECAHGKPHPLPYLTAMELLGETPETCIAFEDSPSGMRAAAASGAYSIGVRSALSDAKLRAVGAQMTIDDFTDPALPDILARIEGVAA